MRRYKDDLELQIVVVIPLKTFILKNNNETLRAACFRNRDAEEQFKVGMYVSTVQLYQFWLKATY